MLLFKIIILGDAGVGKTSLMNNFLDKPFNQHDCATIGVEYSGKIIELPTPSHKFQNDDDHPKPTLLNSKPTAKLSIWNTSGQERFRAIVKSYYRGVHSVIFTCDLTRIATVEHVRYWIEDFENNTTTPYRDVAKVIVATKSDLTDKIQVTEEDLKKLAKEYDIPYFIVSSKLEDNRPKVKTIFQHLAGELWEQYQAKSPEDVKSMETIVSLERPPNPNPAATNPTNPNQIKNQKIDQSLI